MNVGFNEIPKLSFKEDCDPKIIRLKSNNIKQTLKLLPKRFYQYLSSKQKHMSAKITTYLKKKTSFYVNSIKCRFGIFLLFHIYSRFLLFSFWWDKKKDKKTLVIIALVVVFVVELILIADNCGQFHQQYILCQKITSIVKLGQPANYIHKYEDKNIFVISMIEAGEIMQQNYYLGLKILFVLAEFQCILIHVLL